MSKANKIILFFIIGIGFCLRLYRIGAKPFWVDELGVAKAAMMPTLADALNFAHNHVMAMPLDYVMAWLMAQISVAEGWLRLPEAFWGTLNLAAGYLLYREVLEERVALLATFLLALSPALIEYSQELRFYAPLVFFYTMSTAAGLKASREGKALTWLGFAMICLVGIFFHIYAALVLIPVGLYTVSEKETRVRNLGYLTASIFLILIGAIYAMFKYGSFPGETSGLFAFESPWQVILGGLGWVPLFPATAPAWLLGIFSMISAALGIQHLSLSPYRKFVWILLIGIILQISVLLAVTAMKHYFASARQFIMLIPFSALLSAVGIDSLIQKVERYFAKAPVKAHLIYGMVIFALCCLALPALKQYYGLEKGSTRSILRILDKEWQSGQAIYVVPGYNRDLYAHYANLLENNSELASSFTLLETGTNQALPHQATFLISEPSFDGTSLGFDLIYTPPINTLYPDFLWKKK